jgi:(S)-citramalyl-CoA lyase
VSITSGFSSLLFVPGTKPERFAKAVASGADVVCIDLEDSVPADGKAAARRTAIDAIAELGAARLVLRINGLRTRAGMEDLLALAAADHRPAILLMPMVEDVAEVEIALAVLGAGAPAIIPLIETVRGLRNAQAIAQNSGVSALMFGGADFAAELGVALAWEPLLAARGQMVLAAAAAQKPVIDVPYIALDDADGLRAEAQRAKDLGFAAKAAIHPAQIAILHEVFRPTDAEFAEAEEAERAFEAANGAAVRFKGRMLEAPIMRRYQRILAMRSKQHA